MTAKVFRRGFLNKEKGMAAFAADVQYYNADFAYGAFDITDCTRHISLSFDYTTPEEKENSLFKITTLIDELTKFRDLLFVEETTS